MSRSRMNGHLSKKEINSLKDKVLAEIERIQNKALGNYQHFDNETGTKDEVDTANNNILKGQQIRFETRELLYLKKLKKTLLLVDTDEYGVCEECGAQITFGRLMARPTSTMCINCKEAEERTEMQWYAGKRSKSLSIQKQFAGNEN